MRARRESSAVPAVALAGYTNAGKSTLLNALTGAGVGVGERLFHTLDPTTRAYEHDGRRYLVTDTVGFIRKLPAPAGRGLQGDAGGDPARRPDRCTSSTAPSRQESRRESIAAVDSVLEEIGAGEQPRLLVFNKLDLLDAEQRRELLVGERDAIGVSAATGEGIDELRERIERAFEETLSRGRAAACPTRRAAGSRSSTSSPATVERDERAGRRPRLGPDPDGARAPVRATLRSARTAPAPTAPRLAPWSSASVRLRRRRADCRRAPTTATPASTSTRRGRRRSGPASGRASARGSRSRSRPATPAWCCPARGSRCATGSRWSTHPGLIDAGYRGELRVLLLNTDRESEFEITPGDRIAQLVVVAVPSATPVEVSELADQRRAGGGFGSSGR